MFEVLITVQFYKYMVLIFCFTNLKKVIFISSYLIPTHSEAHRLLIRLRSQQNQPTESFSVRLPVITAVTVIDASGEDFSHRLLSRARLNPLAAAANHTSWQSDANATRQTTGADCI